MIALILACSGRKRPTVEPMRAFDLYDGPMWQSLRTQLRSMPKCERAWRMGHLRIIVLSALHGFIDARTEIEPYDLKMTAQRAVALSAHKTVGFAVETISKAEVTCVAGGKLYAELVRSIAPQLGKEDFLSGRGIGMQRKLMNGWLQAWYGDRSA